MTCKTKALIVFSIGASIGSSVTYVIQKKHNDKKTQIQIDEVKKAYGRRLDVVTKPKSKAELLTDVDLSSKPDDIVEYARQLKASKADESLVDYGAFYDKDQTPADVDVTREAVEKFEARVEDYQVSKEAITIISGEGIDDRDCQHLTYYADGTLIDDSGNEVSETDAAGMISDSFGMLSEESGDDCVYVKNDDYGLIFKVSVDEHTFEEYEALPPHML